ncbi:hypothetical protein [Frateuria sp. STR12]|uniref:hypothetical protein n=1 Tax=Frateuria hangzhouensis TaxID=2995589 RepID=UPI002260BE0D|nr:hypothetical protein [Frateuria sp. STR12]MCX7514569.1 hypothetical protein [Frateuria sp. STR12]
MAILAVICIPLASSGLVLRAAIWLGLSFHSASLALACVVAPGWMLAGMLFLPKRPRPGPCSVRLDRAALLALSVACVAAVLSVLCLHRADADDVIYLPKLVYAVAHPGVVMDGAIHEIAHTPVLALPLSAAAYYPTAYEFSQAAFAHLSGIDLLWVYYRLAPALTTWFGVLLLAFNLHYLGVSRRASAVAVLLLVPLLLLMGESHRSLGNFTLVRMYQAKCAFIFLGLQIFTALSLLFFRKPDIARWMLLLVGVIAVSGMTTSALVMLPLLSLPLFLAWWLAFGHGGSLSASIGRGAAYVAALSPAFAFALDFRGYALARAAYGSSLNAGFPGGFHGQLNLVTGGSALSPTLLLFASSALVLAGFWREPRHRFLLAMAALTVMFYLNPWMGPWVMRYLTSENIYWRLFYLLPLLLMMGAAVGALFEKVGGGALLRRGVPFVCFAALVAAVFVSPSSVMRPGNRVEVSAQGYPLGIYAEDARACLRLARPGVILAPVVLAQNMAVLSARHAQVVTRPDFLANALFGDREEFKQRMSAAAAVAGKGGRLEDLVAVVRRVRPSTVVVARKALTATMASTLADEGFHTDGATGRWIVYGRAVTGPMDR